MDTTIFSAQHTISYYFQYCLLLSYMYIANLVLFVESQRKPSDLILVILNCAIATQSKGVALHKMMMQSAHNLDLVQYDLARFLCHQATSAQKRHRLDKSKTSLTG